MEDSFDYIIVGGGSAGAVVAARLSQRAANNVLLLEAGPRDNSLLIRMPLAFRLIRQLALFDWGYKSEPEPYANGRSIHAPRGKVLGGSSAVNGMVYTRGHPRDFDQWAQMGARGWSYDDVLPYFRKSERSDRGPSEWRGADGAMGVTRISQDDPVARAIEAAATALGYPVVGDLEAGSPDGFGRPDLTVGMGRRASTAEAFLAPARKRSNLRIITDAQVSRIMFDGSRAVGVEYRLEGATLTARCEREIVLSGGAYGSPHLLMLSGVGPADHLREHGIDVVADHPGVGAGLQEHPLVPMIFRSARPTKLRAQIRADRVALSVLKWLASGQGLMATQPLSSIAYYRSQPHLERPDLEFALIPTALDAKVWFPGVRKPGEDLLTAYNIVLRPLSRGSVRLKSADPLDAPVIQFNLLEAEDDVERLRYGIEWTRKLMATRPLNEVVGEETLPGYGIADPKDVTQFIRAAAVTAQHPACTCRMGVDPGSVVDPQLRVHRVEGLRVADASIMPTLVGAHTNAASIMIGERAADFIGC